MSIDFSYQKHFLDLQIIRSRFGSYFCAISQDAAQSPNCHYIHKIKNTRCQSHVSRESKAISK